MGGEGEFEDDDGDLDQKNYGEVHIFDTKNNTCQL